MKGPDGFESNRTPAGPDYASPSVAQYLNYRKTSIYVEVTRFKRILSLKLYWEYKHEFELF